MSKGDSLIEQLKNIRVGTISNVYNLISTSKELFEKNQYPIACFLAMTSIEELGKLTILFNTYMAVSIGSETKTPPDRKGLNEIEKMLRDHPQKAAEAASHCLKLNTGADRRHGAHKSGYSITDGIIVLARSNGWMEVRNSCLYTDIKLNMKKTSIPCDAISREYAYYFICMAQEMIAEVPSLAIVDYQSMKQGKTDYHKIVDKYYFKHIKEIDEFMKKYSKTVDLNKLDIFDKYGEKNPPQSTIVKLFGSTDPQDNSHSILMEDNLNDTILILVQEEHYTKDNSKKEFLKKIISKLNEGAMTNNNDLINAAKAELSDYQRNLRANNKLLIT